MIHLLFQNNNNLLLNWNHTYPFAELLIDKIACAQTLIGGPAGRSYDMIGSEDCETTLDHFKDESSSCRNGWDVLQ